LLQARVGRGLATGDLVVSSLDLGLRGRLNFLGVGLQTNLEDEKDDEEDEEDDEEYEDELNEEELEELLAEAELEEAELDPFCN
jgi:hypothetical protein